MIDVITGPLVCQPRVWTLVFSREARTRWLGWLAMGRYKHVRAYTYVPFLHHWIFYDVHLRGVDLFTAEDGPPALDVIRVWTQNADLVMVPRETSPQVSVMFSFCVPAMKKLLGIRSSALRPDALYAHCIANGCTPISGAADAGGLSATARPEQAGR